MVEWKFLIFWAMTSVLCISAEALYYHPSDPCNLVPYEYLRTQLCCNGTVYADPPFIYTCCYDFVCYRVNNMPVDPKILHPISRYFAASKPGLASGQGAQPGVPVPPGVFALPDYDAHAPSTLIDGETNNKTASIGGNFTSPVVARSSNASSALSSQSNSYVQAEEKPDQQQQTQQQQQQQQPLQQSADHPFDNFRMDHLPNFPNFPHVAQFASPINPQNNPYYVRNQGPVHQYFLPLGKQWWNPFQAMFQETTRRPVDRPEPISTILPLDQNSATTAHPAVIGQPGFAHFLQNFFAKDTQFNQRTTAAPVEETGHENELFCDGINLTILQQANPNLACCAKMVIYDSRLYSCIESDSSTTTAAATTAAAAGGAGGEEELTTVTTPVLVPVVSTTAAPVAAGAPLNNVDASLNSQSSSNNQQLSGNFIEETPPVQSFQQQSQQAAQSFVPEEITTTTTQSPPAQLPVVSQIDQLSANVNEASQVAAPLEASPSMSGGPLAVETTNNLNNNLNTFSYINNNNNNNNNNLNNAPLGVDASSPSSSSSSSSSEASNNLNLGNLSKVVLPARRSAKQQAGGHAPPTASITSMHHNHLPADFVPLTCGIHDYFIDPSISSKFACCGDAIFDVSLELCEHVWGMYYAMAAVPINEEGKTPATPARLDCSELKTYIFGNPSTAANYSC